MRGHLRRLKQSSSRSPSEPREPNLQRRKLASVRPGRGPRGFKKKSMSGGGSSRIAPPPVPSSDEKGGIAMAGDEITVSGISFNHGTNGEYEFYAPTDH